MTHRGVSFTRSLSLFSTGIALLACGAAGPDARAPAKVSSGITERGETIYFGRVFPLAGSATEPTYVYERRVDDRGGELVSTHITREPAGAFALVESAKHSADYALGDYTLHTDQLGRTGSIRVDERGVHFRLVDGADEQLETEETSLPVVVGPTLVGYIVRHMEELRAHRTLEIRLAVLERLETLGFELRAVDSVSGETRIEMKPSSFFVGLVVDPVLFTFDSTSKKLVRLEGRVPPKVRDGNRWADFDARVDYRYVATAYR